MNMTKPARNLDPALQSMMPVLYLIATASFAANLSVRAIDPVLPHIADDLAVSIAEAAGLSAALAFTFAIVQPIVGAVADLIGKARVMITCLGLLGIGSILGAFADSFPLLLATRVLCGIGAGGVFPVTLSLTSDLVPIAARQIAISRVLAGAMIGDLTSAGALDALGTTALAPRHGEIILAFSPERFAAGRPGNPFESAEILFGAISGQGARLPSSRRYAARTKSEADGIMLSEAEMTMLDNFLAQGLGAVTL